MVYDETKEKNSKHAESRSCVHRLRHSWDGLIDQSAQTCGYLTNYCTLQTVTPRSCRSFITNHIAVVCFCPILIRFTLSFDEKNLGITCEFLEGTGGQSYRYCEERRFSIQIYIIFLSNKLLLLMTLLLALVGRAFNAVKKESLQSKYLSYVFLFKQIVMIFWSLFV